MKSKRKLFSTGEAAARMRISQPTLSRYLTTDPKCPRPRSLSPFKSILLWQPADLARLREYLMHRWARTAARSKAR